MRDHLVNAAHDGATAMLFLTRVPVPWRVPDVERRLGRSAPWFPAVGLAIGGVGALAWWGAATLWNPLIGAVLAIAATALLTGAFHEDGLGDTFDGLGGGPDRTRALEIMKDSRLGTFGALALMLVVLARIAALTALGAAAPAALIGAHAFARYTSLPLIRSLPYARAIERAGTARPFVGGISRNGLLAATAVTLIATAALWGAAAPVAWLAGALATAVIAAWSWRRLGGITGDTLGAANQLAEVAIYLALAA